MLCRGGKRVVSQRGALFTMAAGQGKKSIHRIARPPHNSMWEGKKGKGGISTRDVEGQGRNESHDVRAAPSREKKRRPTESLDVSEGRIRQPAGGKGGGG